MGTGLARKVAELKQRVARLERKLEEQNRAARPAFSRPTVSRTAQSGEAAVANSSPVLAGSDRAIAQRAEKLFSELLEMQPPRLISYSAAYRRILGAYSVWRNAVHAPAVIAVACRTSPRKVGPLSVRLDALIVGKVTRRPAKGHFTEAAYSESDWIQTFGTWTLLE